MSDPTPPADKSEAPVEDQERVASTGEELPPLPDGGLSGAMPTWLQQAPSRPARTHAPETVDLSSLAEGVEVPEWLTELSRRVEAGSTSEKPLDEERPLAEAVIKDAPEVGEPEAALGEPALAEAADAQITEAESEPAPETPEPMLRFQVRSETRTVPDPVAEASSASHQASPEPRYQMRAPAPPAPRSTSATVLLVLLLIALAAAGVWFYWM